MHTDSLRHSNCADGCRADAQGRRPEPGNGSRSATQSRRPRPCAPASGLPQREMPPKTEKATAGSAAGVGLYAAHFTLHLRSRRLQPASVRRATRANGLRRLSPFEKTHRRLAAVPGAEGASRQTSDPLRGANRMIAADVAYVGRVVSPRDADPMRATAPPSDAVPSRAIASLSDASHRAIASLSDVAPNRATASLCDPGPNRAIASQRDVAHVLSRGSRIVGRRRAGLPHAPAKSATPAATAMRAVPEGP